MTENPKNKKPNKSSKMYYLKKKNKLLTAKNININAKKKKKTTNKNVCQWYILNDYKTWAKNKLSY